MVETRRHFDPTRDAKRFVMLLDEGTGRLYEVVGVRGMGDPRQPGANAAVKLLDAARDLPGDPFEALDTATWIPIEEATALAVVKPSRHDGGADGT